MSNIITVEEFASFRDLPKKLDSSKIEESISLAQQSDLLNILGDFYFDLIANLENAEYIPLLDGGGFEYCNNHYSHAGIKKLLADYAYARFIYMINVNLTPFGVVTKMMHDSEKVDRNTIKDLSKQAQIDAGYKFKYIDYYLKSDTTLFSRYCDGKDSDTPFNSQKFDVL